jgi:hypothetical protein
VDSGFFRNSGLGGFFVGLFKQKIEFGQFLAELITFQLDFLERNFDKLVVLADECKVLTEKDKEEFFDKAQVLIIVDIMTSCIQHFSKHLSSEDIGETVDIVYARYLTEYKKVSKVLAEEKLERIMELLKRVCKAEEEYKERDEHYKKIGLTSYPKIDNDIDKQKMYLCSGFAEYCAGEDLKAENWEGKRFAAFKLAMGFVKGDIVDNALNHYAVIFDNNR